MQTKPILQGSSEWHQQRIGRFTASEIYRLMGDVKREMTDSELKSWKEANPKSTAKQCVDDSLLSEAAMTYVLEVASERLTGLPAKQEIDNKSTEWGKIHEHIAADLYAAVYEADVQLAEFIPYLSYGGASPDRFIGDDTGLEIKCPMNAGIHMQYRTLLNWKDLKEKHKNHYWQIVDGMLCSGRRLWKFLSYHPSFQPEKQMKIIDIPWIESDINLLKIKKEAAEKDCNHVITL